MAKDKLKCPLCNTEATYIHNLIAHINGAHIKKGEVDILIASLMQNYSEGDLKSRLLQEFIGYEPEYTAEDEELLFHEDFNDSKFLNDYLSRVNPICREERQYALMLSNKLRSNDKGIKSSLGLSENIEIIEVYFEVTIMRDYWSSSKAKFNMKLVEFMEMDSVKKYGVVDEFEVGPTREKNHPNYWLKPHPIACWMINAKPDIGVLVYDKNTDEIKLFLLECKYLSKISQYTDRIDNNKILGNQIDIQNLILEFVCEHYGFLFKYNDKEYKVKKGDTKLVKFNLNRSRVEESSSSILIRDLF